MSSRIHNAELAAKVMDADSAAAMIDHDANIGFSGFTGSGYPKALPMALARRIQAAHEAGQEFKVGVWTGASTAPDLDGVLADVDGVKFRTPYQSDPSMRRAINAGVTRYADIHLSHLAQQVAAGFLGNLDFAVVEATAITESGELVPSSSLGNNRTFLEIADKIIIEVNSWQSADLFGMHDIYYGPIRRLPPHRLPFPIIHAGDRIGQRTLMFDPSKVVAVIETDSPDRNTPFKAPDAMSRQIAGYLLDFLECEVRAGRLPRNLLPLQSGVGNIANAVLAGLLDSHFEHLTSYTEVIQDGMVDMLDAGKLDVASATAFSLSPAYAHRMNDKAAEYRSRIVLRPQDLSNSGEVIRRLGVIACNGMIEADMYGNVNSTHIMGTQMQNGIGGSGDFTRNAFISCFVSPSTAKNGAISAIVPMVSHVDHTEHDVAVIITEQGLADLRGLAPRQRAQAIIDRCVHPDYRAQLQDYFDRACAASTSQHTPHLLTEALRWHQNFLEHGTMRLG